MLSEPSQRVSKSLKFKKITKFRARKRSRVVLGILADAGNTPQQYVSRYVAHRGAE